MSKLPVITREIAAMPERADDAHKGEAGRVIIIGGCAGRTMMVGAPALTANAAFRSGAGLVQMVIPAGIQPAVAALAPCATSTALPQGAQGLLDIIRDFNADAVGLGPGLGDSLPATTLLELMRTFEGPMVVDADGLNLLATTEPTDIPNPRRITLTPHPGEMRRLLDWQGVSEPFDKSTDSRRAAACALVEATGCTVVLKGKGTVATDGERLYTNETGNAGLATGGAGDVLTGVLVGLAGQGMDPLEGAILGVFVHGLAGDFAAEERGRLSMMATDLLDFLPDAFSEQTDLQGD